MEEPATWDAAQKACEQQGGNLASIDMSYDQAFVAGVVLQGRADAWIGLRRKVETHSTGSQTEVPTDSKQIIAPENDTKCQSTLKISCILIFIY